MPSRAPSSGRASSACCARISTRSTAIASSTPSSWATSACGTRWPSATSLYAEPEMTHEAGMRLGELEGIVGEEDGYSAESDAAILLQGLDIADELHERKMAELQGGQKVRVLLAQALFGHPEALLLDEPTNHLDLDSIHWLEEFLNRYEGTLIVISHDRHFLNARLHAHRRHRLPDDHHLHRRLRRHGGREDADSHDRSKPTTRSARRRSRSSTTSFSASAPARAPARRRRAARKSSGCRRPSSRARTFSARTSSSR